MDQHISFSIKRKILGFFFALCFVVVGCFLIWAPDRVTHNSLVNQIFLGLVGLVSVLFFGGLFLLSLFTFYFRKTALRVTHEGIYDFSNLASAGLIPWSQIKRIHQIEHVGNAGIRIVLIDPEAYMKANGSWLAKIAMRATYREFGTPILVPMFLLNSYVDRLERELVDAFNAYKLQAGDTAQEGDVVSFGQAD